jgi:hypothetical protein
LVLVVHLSQVETHPRWAVLQQREVVLVELLVVVVLPLVVLVVAVVETNLGLLERQGRDMTEPQTLEAVLATGVVVEVVVLVGTARAARESVTVVLGRQTA